MAIVIRRIPWVVLLVAGVMVAQAVLPLRTTEILEEQNQLISQELRPLQTLVADLTGIYVRQQARLQEYLLTGSNVARDQVNQLRTEVVREQLNELRREENRTFEELDQILSRRDDVTGNLRIELARVLEAATAWQLRHSAALESAEGRAGYIQDVATGMESYEELLLALENARDTLDGDLARALDRLRE
ncbi:MAG: hypothetical protein P8188_12150, partial [Gemmatimonadota bacterium]